MICDPHHGADDERKTILPSAYHRHCPSATVTISTNRFWSPLGCIRHKNHEALYSPLSRAGSILRNLEDRGGASVRRMPRSVVIERDDDRARGGGGVGVFRLGRALEKGRLRATENFPFKGLPQARRLGCFPFRLLWFELHRVVSRRPSSHLPVSMAWHRIACRPPPHTLFRHFRASSLPGQLASR
jgi:hypothetical protein